MTIAELNEESGRRIISITEEGELFIRQRLYGRAYEITGQERSSSRSTCRAHRPAQFPYYSDLTDTLLFELMSYHELDVEAFLEYHSRHRGRPGVEFDPETGEQAVRKALIMLKLISV